MKSKKSVSEIIDTEKEDLEKELEKLQYYLDFKNRRFCKRFLKNIIKKYFKNNREE